MKIHLDTSLNELSETQSFYVEKKETKDNPYKRNQTILSDMSRDVSPRSHFDLVISKAKRSSEVYPKESNYSEDYVDSLKSPLTPSNNHIVKKPSTLAKYLKSNLSSKETSPQKIRPDVTTSG